jgi:hypothetical protein
MRTPLLSKDLDVLMRFTLLWAEQQEIGFPRTLGIGDNNVGRDRGRHTSPLYGSVVVTILDV